MYMLGFPPAAACLYTKLRPFIQRRCIIYQFDRYAMRRIFVVALVFCTFLITRSNALYSSSSDVVSLTDSNFESKIKSGGVWLVEFYAPWVS